MKTKSANYVTNEIKLIILFILLITVNNYSDTINGDLRVTRSLKAKFIPVQSYEENCFAGHQDNFLAFADKRFTVTQQGPAPSSGNISFAFDASHYNVRWNSDDPIIIEIDLKASFDYWRAFGVNFTYKRWAKNVMIEGYSSKDSTWITFYNITNNNGNVTASTSEYSYISKLRFTISGIVNHGEIAIEEIWAFSAHVGYNKGGAFLRKDGGDVYGNLNVKKEISVNEKISINNENFINMAKFKAESYGDDFEFGANRHLVKIKTNIPFYALSQMPFIVIEGYDYPNGNTIGLSIVWRVWDNQFINVKGSSWGSLLPKVTLAVEANQKIVIILEKEKPKRWFAANFTINAEQSYSTTYNTEWFRDWTFAAEPVLETATHVTPVPFLNSIGKCDFYGDVTIGREISNANLTVNGSINCTSPNATVTASAFKVGDWVIKEKNVPDYVFKEDYHLKPLQEVEKFTRENNHLPDVPSASQMKKEGVDLVEMNMNMLRKIEELTLYIIEQQKRIELLEKDIKKENEK